MATDLPGRAEGTSETVRALCGRLLRSGPETLSDAALVAVWLGLEPPVARIALEKAGGLTGLFGSALAPLGEVRGLGPARLARLSAARVLLRRQARATLVAERVFTCSNSVRRFLRLELAPSRRELFAALFLDGRHRLLRYEVLALGTIDRAIVHPREVLKRCLELNAAALILAHNHPSGVAEPSPSDVELTRKLSRLLKEVDVRLLDHLVVGCGSEVSLAERGFLE